MGGKSSLINSLNRSKVVGVGSTPGFTKVMQEVHLDKKVKLLDCPGIVFASGSEKNAGEIMLRNCVKVEKILDPVQPVEAILKKCNPVKLMIRYKIPEYKTVNEFLCHIARRRGKLMKGGIPDCMDAARIVLQDWNNGGISYYTVPPESDKPKSIHETATVVSGFAEEFDIDALFEESDATLMVLSSIDSVPDNNLVETMCTEESDLDSMFVNMAIEEKQEESEEEEFAMDEDSDDENHSTPHVMNPVRADDEFNPQTNQQRKKALKKQKKKAKKQKTAFVQEEFDFSADFVADNEIEGSDDDDEDLLDM